jgi:hemoglobin
MSIVRPADGPARDDGASAHAVCSEAEAARLVHTFYAKVRADPALGPIFNAHVADWDAHLAKLVDFWSALLRGTTRFHGSPMHAHAALPGLTLELFDRWLTLFRATTREIGTQAMRRQADLIAQRIAAQLWLHYQQEAQLKARDGQRAVAKEPEPE